MKNRKNKKFIPYKDLRSQDNEKIQNFPFGAINIGFEHGSYFAGFVEPLKQSGFTQEMLTNIIVAKLSLEYQQEISRMRFETEERIAEIYSSSTETYLDS